MKTAQWIILIIVIIAACAAIIFFFVKFYQPSPADVLEEAINPETSEEANVTTTIIAELPLTDEEEKALLEAQAKDRAELDSQPTEDPRPDNIKDQSDTAVSFTDNKISIDFYNVAEDRIDNVTVETDESSVLSTPLENACQSIFGKDAASKIKTNYILLDDNNLYIDFTSDIYSVSMGSYSEGQLLEAISNAYLDNMKEVHAVYYSVDGQDYATGHIELSKDVPYKSK